MKHAKLALTTIIILTAIGGTLALKANRIAATFYYQAAGMPNCSAPTTILYIPDFAGTYITYLSTTTITGKCPQIRLRIRL